MTRPTILVNGTPQQVGLQFGCFARARPDATDLTACFTFSEVVTNQADAPGAASSLSRIAIQTNLDTALRLQILKGSGFFLLNTNAPDASRQRIGILMEPP